MRGSVRRRGAGACANPAARQAAATAARPTARLLLLGHLPTSNKIYEHGSPSSAVKVLFVRQVEQIAWQFKLAPETINLMGTRSVPEIQIFSIFLKGGGTECGCIALY